MKTSMLTLASMALISLSAGAAFAGHHEGGMDGKSKKGYYMKKMDTNEDGQISKDEFMAKYEKKFDKKDTNGDGFISKDEMKEAKKEMKKKWKEKKEKMKEGKSDY